jgi:HK97 gp10 family phage protein
MDSYAIRRGQEMAERLRDFGHNAETAVEKALLKGAMQIVADAKKELTDGPNKALDTGFLRASLTQQLHKNAGNPYAIVGSNVEYAPYVEFGTSKMAARPFLRTAIEKNIAEIKKEIAQAVREAW